MNLLLYPLCLALLSGMPKTNPDFEAFKALFPPLALPYTIDSLDFDKLNGQPIDSTFAAFVRFSRIEQWDRHVPSYLSIGQFQINSDLTALVYFCDGWFGQAAPDYQVILGIYNQRGRLIKEEILYDNGGYMYDYADGDGIGDYSMRTFSTIGDCHTLIKTEIKDNYLRYKDSISWEPIIRSDSTIWRYKISARGNFEPLAKIISKKKQIKRKNALTYGFSDRSYPDEYGICSATWMVCFNPNNNYFDERKVKQECDTEVALPASAWTDYRVFGDSILEITEHWELVKDASLIDKKGLLKPIVEPEEMEWERTKTYRYFKLTDSGFQILEQGNRHKPDRSVPFLSHRLLTEEELLVFQAIPGRLRLIRNQLFAEYGYSFQSKDLVTYFSAKTWYYPNEKSSETILAQMTDIERLNVELLAEFEN